MGKIEKEWSNRNVLSVESVAAYVRVSTQEQKLHGLSLDAQKAKLEEYAKEHNMKIVAWYIDEGVSARKLIRKRPELQRMIQDAEEGKFERIIFIKLDRFFRSVAEYHECMKRISPIVWTTTEEEYDLTTANGRMLVNMKLTIAELEADMAGERVNIVNEYKVSTGQPLSGSMPFGFKIVVDPNTGRKKIIKDPDDADVLEDLIQHYMTHQSKKGTIVYAHAAHHISISHDSLTRLLTNTMLMGAYRDNPIYCEAYLTPEEFNKLQDLLQRNVKHNTTENRAYFFSGLIKCPECGCTLKGNVYQNLSRDKKTVYKYKKYRCGKSTSAVYLPTTGKSAPAYHAKYSSSVNGLYSSNVFTLSFICSVADIPLKTMCTLGRSWRKRKAQAGMDSSGRLSFNMISCVSPNLASFPPRTGSITHTGIPSSVSISYFSFAPCNVQSK